MNVKLKEYAKLVEFLATTLGPNYEIALYDMTGIEPKIAVIANDQLTDRKVGDGLSPYMAKVVSEKRYLEDDFVFNYTAKAKSGRFLRSSTLFIKDNNELIGILNLNFDDFMYVDIVEQLLRLNHPDEHLYRTKDLLQPEEAVDNISTSPFDVVDDALNLFFRKQNIDLTKISLKRKNKLLENLDQDSRLEIIKELNDKGVFLIKGAVVEVAQKMNCSEPTIYRYLSKLK